MTQILSGKKILCLDFDGVCHSYTSGWQGATVIPDPPVPDMWEFLTDAGHHFEIHIFSSRSGQPGGIEAMKDWFINWYVKQQNAMLEGDEQPITKAQATPIVTAMLHFPEDKPAAFVGIDDRVITFTGHWPSTTALLNFQPWNKRPVG